MTSFNIPGSEQAEQLALNLMKSGTFGTDVDFHSGRVLDPIPIRSLDGNFVGWFVGFAVESNLVGFFVFGSGLEFKRYSTFLNSQGRLKNCPKVADWLDPECIIRRASLMVQSGESLEEPFLSYDQNLERLAWAVRSVDRDGGIRIIFVIGDVAYVGRHENEPSTG